ncbi:MAG TPA: malectin [Candidatus Acidoferrum sp.]|jgi:hypothetical protein
MHGFFTQRFFVLGLIFVGFSPVANAQQKPIRVNCGGPAYTDAKGHLWQADTGFNAGSEFTLAANVTGTTDPALYRTQRWNASRTTALIYSFPVADGSYQVNLYFAETFASTQHPGARVFNVKIQGEPAFTNLDVFAAVGANKALEKTATANVANGRLTIEFDDEVQNAEINAIEILPTASSGPQLSLNFKYPDGTPVAGTLAYTVTSTLLTFQGSEPLTNGQVSAALFASPSALGISAQFQVKLSLKDTAGRTLWELNVGMNPADVNLAAVLNSALSVTVQKM